MSSGVIMVVLRCWRDFEAVTRVLFLADTDGEAEAFGTLGEAASSGTEARAWFTGSNEGTGRVGLAFGVVVVVDEGGGDPVGSLGSLGSSASV